MLSAKLLLPFAFTFVAGCSSRSGVPTSGSNGPAPAEPANNAIPAGASHDIVIAPQAPPSSIKLADGMALAGDPMRIQVLSGKDPTVQLSLSASQGAETWTLIASADLAMFKTGNLVLSVTQSAARPGIASVQRWVSQVPTPAVSGVVSLAKTADGWAGTVKTEKDVTTATLTTGAIVSCFVTAEELGVKQNGSPGPGVGAQMVPDVEMKSAFCSQFK